MPKNVEQEGRGNTNHHSCHWNSREGHSKLPLKDTRQAQSLQSAKVSHPGNSTHPKEGTVNQARLKVTAQNNQPCES